MPDVVGLVPRRVTVPDGTPPRASHAAPQAAQVSLGGCEAVLQSARFDPRLSELLGSKRAGVEDTQGGVLSVVVRGLPHEHVRALK